MLWVVGALAFAVVVAALVWVLRHRDDVAPEDHLQAYAAPAVTETGSPSRGGVIVARRALSICRKRRSACSRGAGGASGCAGAGGGRSRGDGAAARGDGAQNGQGGQVSLQLIPHVSKQVFAQVSQVAAQVFPAHDTQVPLQLASHEPLQLASQVGQPGQVHCV